MYVVRFIKPINIPMFVCKFPRVFRKSQRYYHAVPFIDLYKKITGSSIPDNVLPDLRKKHPKIVNINKDQLHYILQILSKFGINPEDACHNPHLFCMNPISLENYGDILRECNFAVILPKHIIRYHTLVKSKTISQLKKEGLLKEDLILEKLLHEQFHEWPKECINLKNFQDSSTNILTVRMSVLERYLQWKLCITPDDFTNYCKNYLPLKHRPMSDIKEALNIAQNNIKFDTETIRRNGFIIAADPANTMLILENVDSLGGLDIREAIRFEPAILKSNYQSILEIKNLLEQYNISKHAQQNCFKIYCMNQRTVRERLEQLINIKEYQVLSTNPRVLHLVVHEKKMMQRLEKIQAARKQCYSLNNLVSSTKIFNTYISSFGNKVCSRDIGALICSSLQGDGIEKKTILEKLKRHKYLLHTALNVIDENIQTLKKQFNDEVIFDNCQILLYPIQELQLYIDFLLKVRNGDASVKDANELEIDASYNNLNCRTLTDSQILSLALYEIEKKYHFSGDGIWNRLDRGKPDMQTAKQKVKQN